IIMNGIYSFFNLLGIQNIALCIFVFTFITKTLMLPLTIKQQKFTRLSSRMNPEIQKIQAKYKGKKDEASIKKQQSETQAIYQKYGASPTAGCLPMLIMLPIMFALYEVINNVPGFVTLIREQYTIVAGSIFGDSGLLASFAEIISKTAADFPTADKIIDALADFKTSQWDILHGQVSGDAVGAINYIGKANNLFGLNIMNNPSWKSVSVIVPVLAMGLQFIQSKQISVKKDPKNDNPTANAMSSMNVVMPIMSGFFCLILPIGVGLYWIANSLFSIVQQYFVNKYMDNMNMDEMIEKSSAKASKKYSKMVSTNGSLQELARKQTKSIESSVSENVKDEVKDESPETVEENNEVPGIDSKAYKPSSISEIANLLKSRNNEKGDK
ncbi:MAG TPA: YidC/Oxa1 family membrane protein insertase, partial [Mobilitalea sp.]|nr:YidC/Oxa1 family membrane protein insertase [Mobilitalea sp.]